jgi:hypothetical protein
MIHVVGNSHACFFSGTDVLQGLPYWEKKMDCRIAEIKVYTLGPCTAYQFDENHGDVLDILGIPKGENVLMVLGEIDCRWQIPYHSPTLIGSLAGVEDTIRRYKVGLDKMHRRNPIGVWAVHPPSRGIPKPSVGQCSFRHAITHYWNDRMQELCDQCGWQFFSIFHRVLASDGLIDMKYMLDDIHLAQTAMPYAKKELERWL